MRPAARAYIAALVLLAITLLLPAAARMALPTSHDLLLAAAIAGCTALAWRFPLNFAFRTKLYVDTAVIVAAILLFVPGIAMLAVGTGTLLGHGFRRAPRDWAEALFNAAQVMLQAAVGGAMLTGAGWDPARPAFGQPTVLLILPAAVGAMHLVNVLAVATIVALQEGLPLVRTWLQSLREDVRSEVFAQLSLLAVGVLAAVVADAQPWALGLLGAPVVATFLALEHLLRHRREAELARRSSEAGLAQAQRIARLGSWEWDLGTGEQVWSDEAYRIFGFAPRAFVPTRDVFLSRVHGEDRARVDAALGEATTRGTCFSVEHRVLRADGSERIVHQRGEVMIGAAGHPVRLLGTVHDVTERKALEAELAYRASHDPLTGLPNRTLFAEHLERALGSPGCPRGGLAVLFLDLDGFKLVNDSLGHEAGDRLLIAVGERLRGCIRAGATAARLGGDEFAILVEGMTSPGEATGLAERLIEALGAFPLEGSEAFVTASIGIAVDEVGVAEPADLLRAADIALYRSKAAGRGKHTVYEPAMLAPAVVRLEREGALQRAVERGELRLHYQPEVGLATGRVVGLEALVRWQHPELGVLPPDDFIRLAEETGAIIDIGRWVLGEACRQARAWREVLPGRASFVLGVNLSALQLEDAGLVAEVASLLQETGLDPRSLELEITESVAVGARQTTARALRGLRELGVRLAVDDFGTGHSSLGLLRDLAPDVLKVDRSFVAAMGYDERSRAIVWR